jgi:hypothetical protein
LLLKDSMIVVKIIDVHVVIAPLIERPKWGNSGILTTAVVTTDEERGTKREA